MTGRVVLRWYDHKAYDVWRDRAPTGAFLIAAHRGWELRTRPAYPTDPAVPPHRTFDRYRNAGTWLRSDEGLAWLDQIPRWP